MANRPLILKTSHHAWVYDGDADTLTEVTDADYPALTVPGAAYLDGTYYVMTPAGELYGSDIEQPLVWTALNFLTAETEPDQGVSIRKYLNYVVAFKQWSTEFFYDAQGAAPGSPLLPAENLFMQVGCAAARSIAQTDTAIIWLAQNKEGSLGASAGRSIVLLEGTQVRAISSPYVDRIVTGDNLTEVHAKAFKHKGHSFYELTLIASNITLVYCLGTKQWYQWTSRTAQAPKAITNLVLGVDGVTATATLVAHGYLDGDVVIIAGAVPTAYNGSPNISYVDADHFSWQVAGAPATPATGVITATGYDESYFKPFYHTAVAGTDLFADATSGRLYPMTETSYDDNGSYIDMLVRTPNIDMGTNQYKQLGSADLIGDRVVGNALLRKSKDDYVTHTNYVAKSMALERTHWARLGRARRVSFDVRITDAVLVRLERLDIPLEGEQ